MPPSLPFSRSDVGIAPYGPVHFFGALAHMDMRSYENPKKQ